MQSLPDIFLLADGSNQRSRGDKDSQDLKPEPPRRSHALRCSCRFRSTCNREQAAKPSGPDSASPSLTNFVQAFDSPSLTPDMTSHFRRKVIEPLHNIVELFH